MSGRNKDVCCMTIDIVDSPISSVSMIIIHSGSRHGILSSVSLSSPFLAISDQSITTCVKGQDKLAELSDQTRNSSINPRLGSAKADVPYSSNWTSYCTRNILWQSLGLLLVCQPRHHRTGHGIVWIDRIFLYVQVDPERAGIGWQCANAGLVPKTQKGFPQSRSLVACIVALFYSLSALWSYRQWICFGKTLHSEKLIGSYKVNLVKYNLAWFVWFIMWKGDRSWNSKTYPIQWLSSAWLCYVCIAHSKVHCVPPSQWII